MPVEVILPKVDMDMSHGTLAVWHVAEGELVTKGAALFDIETDKAAMEVEAPASGRLLGITARPGDTVAVGTVVALIYGADEPVGETPSRPALDAPSHDAPGQQDPTDVPPPHPPSTPLTPPGAAAADTPQTGNQATSPRATPAARAAARAAGMDLDSIPGTGPLGRIQRDDVVARAGPDPIASPVHWVPQTGPLHVSHRKGAGIPMVLLHGFTADSQSWAPLEKAIGPDRALLRIDLPGHGRSPRRRVASFAALTRMMVEAFDEACRDTPDVHLLGHSLGGALALALADIRPRRVRSLTLISPAGLGPEIDASTLNGIARASRVESLAPWLRRLTATPEGISDDYAKAAMRLRSDPDGRAAQTDMAGALFPDGVQAFDLRPALARLVAPTAILWGRQDRIVPFSQVLAAGGDFAIHLLAAAGHVPQIECPDRVARVLVRHLAAAEAPS